MAFTFPSGLLGSETLTAGDVPVYQTWVFGAILAATLLMLAAEKVHKTAILILPPSTPP